MHERHHLGNVSIIVLSHFCSQLWVETSLGAIEIIEIVDIDWSCRLIMTFVGQCTFIQCTSDTCHLQADLQIWIHVDYYVIYYFIMYILYFCRDKVYPFWPPSCVRTTELSNWQRSHLSTFSSETTVSMECPYKGTEKRGIQSYLLKWLCNIASDSETKSWI